jgi:acyl dehydratase
MFQLHTTFDLGIKYFSEAEIIDFAMQYDPLDFHLSVESGRKSIFKGLVCSGPHPFHYFYKNQWIPKFGRTVVAGIGIDNWRFLKPVYVNTQVHCAADISELTPHADKGTVTVRWHFQFMNDNGTLYQHLDMIVLHKI